MSCEECGSQPAFMHSKSGRFLCSGCIHKDGPGQLQESEYFKEHSFPDLSHQNWNYVSFGGNTMVDDLNKVTRHEDYELNYKIQMMEIRKREKQLWDNNRFCECGANHIHDCECDPEKIRRFRKRRKRKINEEFDEELKRLMKGQLPKDGSQNRQEESS